MGEGPEAVMLDPLMLHVAHAATTTDGIFTLAGVALSGLGLGGAVLAVQRALARRGRTRA